MYVNWGTRHFGGVKRYKDQEIQTQFFHIWYMPVAPANDYSFLVTRAGLRGTTGIQVKLNRQSIFAAYARNGSIVLAIASFLLGMFTETAAWMGVALAFVVGAVYLIGFYGRSTRRENVEREVIGSMTGVYARAEWLPAHICDSMYNKLCSLYAEEGGDWKEDLKHGAVSEATLIYAMSLLNYAADPNAENVDLREQAAALYASC